MSYKILKHGGCACGSVRYKTTGKQDKHGNFIYDNLPEYEYVDITYDTYIYRRKTPKAAETKQICGKKVCRFAQFPSGKRAIMPTVLVELLASRKATATKKPKV